MCLSWNSHTTRTLYTNRAEDDNKTPVTGTGSAGECRYQFTCSLAHTLGHTHNISPIWTHTLSNTSHTNHTHTTYLYTHSRQNALCCQIQLDSDKKLTTNTQNTKDTTIKYGGGTAFWHFHSDSQLKKPGSRKWARALTCISKQLLL